MFQSVLINNGAALPRSANRVDTELIGMARPVRSCSEHTTSPSAWSPTAELVLDRSHRVLRYSPRVFRLHRNGWGNNQRGRLSGSEPIVLTMPGLLHGLIVGPVIAPGRVPNPASSASEAVDVRASACKVTTNCSQLATGGTLGTVLSRDCPWNQHHGRCSNGK